MAKCHGCRWQSTGVLDNGEKILYCIGSPDHEPKYGSEKVIDHDRIFKVSSGQIYRANDLDECHLWHSDRFDKQS